MKNLKKMLTDWAARVRKKSPQEIGLNGTEEEFRAAVRATGYSDKAVRKSLYDGALKAFEEGRPDNLLVMLSEFSDAVASALNEHRERESVYAVLRSLSAKATDPAATVMKLLEKMPGEERQSTLDGALAEALYNKRGENLLTTFIKAGARAEQKDTRGWEGALLIKAAEMQAPVSVLKILHDAGASFEKALLTMRIGGESESAIDRLYIYREQVTGEPAPEKQQALDTKAVLEEIRQLRAEITALKGGQAPVAAPVVKPDSPKA